MAPTIVAEKPLRRWRVIFRTGLGDSDTRTVTAHGRNTDEAREDARRKAEEDGIPFLGTVRTPRRLKLGIDEAHGTLLNGAIYVDIMLTHARVAGEAVTQRFDIDEAIRQLSVALDAAKSAKRAYDRADEEA